MLLIDKLIPNYNRYKWDYKHHYDDFHFIFRDDILVGRLRLKFSSNKIPCVFGCVYKLKPITLPPHIFHEVVDETDKYDKNFDYIYHTLKKIRRDYRFFEPITLYDDYEKRWAWCNGIYCRVRCTQVNAPAEKIVQETLGHQRFPKQILEINRIVVNRNRYYEEIRYGRCPNFDLYFPLTDCLLIFDINDKV